MAMLRRNVGCLLGFRRYYHSHIIPQRPPPPAIDFASAVNPSFVLPEFDRSLKGIGFGFPSFSFGGGSMELMAVPKRKVSPHKRGIRNGPKALKPVPVIVRCKLGYPEKHPNSGERKSQLGYKATYRNLEFKLVHMGLRSSEAATLLLLQWD
ncbi:hypothetical protein LguiA_013435 [Lonicera macranthoides]